MFSDLLRDDVFRLETPRLWLRWPRMADAPAMVKYAGEKPVAEMTAHVPYPYLPVEAEKFIFASRAGNMAGEKITLALTRKGKLRPAEVIGIAGVRKVRDGKAAIGYWLGTPFHKQGLMSEAASALVDLAFRTGDFDELAAETMVHNLASQRVLEKCGFSFLDTGPVHWPVRGGDVQRIRYRLDRENWTQRAHTIAHPPNTISPAA